MLVILLVSAGSWAGIADFLGAPLQSYSDTFGPADIFSDVYGLGNGYLYTYQIVNPAQSGQALSWFSVEILSGVDVQAVGYDVGANQPSLWYEVGDPIISVDALFTDPIEAGETSTTIWFVSTKGPVVLTDGASGGAIGSSYQGSILAPVPEPATMMIMLIGAGLGLGLRKNKA
jgi:hypothetical protein